MDKDIINGFEEISQIASPVGIPIEDASDIHRLGDRLGWLPCEKPSCIRLVLLVCLALCDERLASPVIEEDSLIVLLGFRIQGNHRLI